MPETKKRRRRRIPAHLVVDFLAGTGYYATKRGRKVWEAIRMDINMGAINKQRAVMGLPPLENPPETGENR